MRRHAGATTRIGTHVLSGMRMSAASGGGGGVPSDLSPAPPIDWEPVYLENTTYDNDATTNTLLPTFGGNVVSTSNPIAVTDTPGNGTWFYCLTSEEHSKLSSETSSVVVQVDVSGGLITDIQYYQADTDLWATAPSPPTNFAVANKDGNNQYACTWTEPTDTDDMIVGYNIYYDSTANPSATQAKRIATVPKGIAAWKDWLAVLATKGKWGITSVDKYGNESTILYNDTTTAAGGSGRPTRPGGIPTRTSSTAGLTEMDTRRGRMAAATWTAATMENGTTFKWQPETLLFYDPDTGSECWKMTSTKAYQSMYHDDISVSPWSANGAKMAMRCASRTSQLYGGSQVGFDDWWMTVDTCGTSFRPVNGVRRLGGNYFHWDPQVVGQYWEIGETHLGTGASTNQLSRTTVDADGVCTTNVVVTLSAGSAGGIINKMIWPDGLQLVIENSSTVRWYPIDIAVAGTATQSDSDGYSMDRSYGSYGGHSGAAVVSYHDQYPGESGWAFILTNDSNGGTSTWWRQQVTGTAGDGGPLYTGNDGNDDFGEVWPENHSTIDVGSTYSPWVGQPPDDYDAEKTGYWSHFTPDNWGRYALHSNVSDGTPAGAYGTGIWDIESHAWIVPSMGNQAQHHDWSGWCDSVVSSASTLALNYAEDKILCATYNDADSQYAVAFTHTRVLGGTLYQTLARPGQSPDGTKVAWHSEFLNATDKVDCYWSVCYYPLPPTIRLAQDNGGGEIEIQFVPPKYTTRTWKGHPAYAREIKQYRLWRGQQVNDPPSVDLDDGSGGVNATYTFTEGDEASYVAPNVAIADSDGSTLTSITIVGTSFGQDGADEQIEFGTALFPDCGAAVSGK